MSQLLLFPPPEPPPINGSPELNFDIVLSDGTEVSVHYVRQFISKGFYFDDGTFCHPTSHFEFEGDISETGYRSHFPYSGVLVYEPDDKIMEWGLKIAEKLRKERVSGTAKKLRKQPRRSKNNA
jgi:hypothetical protein